jgi:hypothetical protein
MTGNMTGNMNKKPFSGITRLHNILWIKIIDIQEELSYISPA